MNRPIKGLLLATAGSLLSLGVQAATLVGIDVQGRGLGDTLSVVMRFDGAPPQPTSFAVENPARISIDLPQTRVGLDAPQQTLRRGILESYIALETADRARVVLNMTELAPHILEREGNTLVARVYTPAGGGAAPAPTGEDAAAKVLDVDFRRTETGAGQVKVQLSSPVATVDVRDEGGQVVAEFVGVKLQAPSQTIDVLDFATPVSMVDVSQRRDSTIVAVRPVTNADFERLAYQVGDMFTLELAPLTAEEIARREAEQEEYTGERINFSFQNIEVRALLQIIADIAGKNLVVSDSVGGELTLRLENVPWDQALDIVMRTKGLTKQIDGDVIWVAPTSEVAANEKQELEAIQQRQDLAPLVTEVIQINYASAVELAELLQGEEDGFMSDRGRVSVDERTSVLIVQDTREQLAEIRQLVRQLDIPVRQVLIEARIVIATDDFSKSLGVRAGVTGASLDDDTLYVTSGSVFDAAQVTTGVYERGLVNGSVPIIPDLTPDDPSRLNLDFGASGAGGITPAGIALAILGQDYLLDLELSAIQAEGKGEVISSPRVMTANGKEAYIEQGEEIPFTAITATRISTQFKKAVLALRVTPQITPDNRVILELEVSRDARGQIVPQAGGGTAVGIDTRRVNTQVLVNNGETVVLGGVFEQDDSYSETKVPLLGDIPVLGALFRQKTTDRQSRELLVFVTPKIVSESIVIR